MELQLANHSSYPRIGDSPEKQLLRRTIAQREKGEKPDQDVHAAEDRMTELALTEQDEAGLDIVTDGLIRWYDPVSHIDGKLVGTQIDGPATSVRPEELPMAIEAMQRVTGGFQAYFITHICYGAFELIYPRMLEFSVDNFDLEMSNSGLDMLELFKKGKYIKDISFGAVDVHTHAIEDKPVVEQRVRDVLAVIPKENVWVDPDCGLKTRAVDEAIEKMKVTAQAAKALRG